jgi:cobalt-zinc-cadmium efflux system membrane fusion protein
MKRSGRAFLLLASFAAAAAMGGCRAATSQADAATPPADPPLPANRVRLAADQLGQIRIEEISTHPPVDTIAATGTVEFNGDRTARILPPVSGQVRNLRVNVGDVVKEGDTLFEINSREVAAAIGEHLASHKDLELSEKTYAMTNDLFEHQAASRIALQQAENELAKNRARVQQTEEAIRVLGVDVSAVDASNGTSARMAVRAPLSGTVTERTVTEGQFVGGDTAPLMTLADIRTVWVSADIFERDLHRVGLGQRAVVTTTAYPEDRFGAQVSRIGTVVDAQTRTAKLRFVVQNPEGRLKPGMFITAALFLPPSFDILTMPAKAVFVEEGRSFAYVQVADRDFERRPVDTSPSGSERVRVKGGVSEGTRVVTDGVLLLRQLEAVSGR